MNILERAFQNDKESHQHLHRWSLSQSEYTLNNSQRSEVQRIADTLEPHNPHQPLRPNQVLAYKLAADGLPEPARARMTDFIQNPENNLSGFLLIRNIPNAVRRTPRHHDEPIGAADTTPEKCGAMIASYMGTLFAVADEQKGRSPHAVIPIEGQEAAASSASSRKPLGMHHDNIGSRQARPDLLVLTCIKPDAKREAATTIASTYDICSRLSPAAKRILRKPIFEFASTASFANSERIPPVKVAILAGSEDWPVFTYRSYGVKVPDGDLSAEEALKELDRVVEEETQQIYLEAGDVLVLKNGAIPFNTLHGRSDFEALWDERAADNRYLIRYFASLNWTELQPFCYPQTHVVVPTELYRVAFA